MKKYISFILLLILTTAWLILTTWHVHGLNSVQNLIAFRDGLLNKGSLPATGTEKVNSPAGDATALIDTLGIPHIFGRTDEAVAYAAGYMHARDRYFQMELIAYTVMGRLSEVVGEDGVYSDQNWRRFGFERKAAIILDSLSRSEPALYNYLMAYAQGVNDYIRGEDEHRRDPMYLVWNYTPRPWQPYYCFLVQWYMSYDLTFYDDYFDRQELLNKLPDNIRNIVYPAYKKDQPLIIPPPKGPALSRIPSVAHAGVLPVRGTAGYTPHPANKSLGSNNWVLGREHTSNGTLLLCNDLHLALTAPDVFYEMDLHGPGMHVYGFTLPGVPLVLTGHNGKIAWGVTNGGWDVTEQYLLKTDPVNKDRYWLDGKWKDMETRHFPIRVKGRPDQDYIVQYTVFGPVVRRDSVTYALHWHPADRSTAVQAFWQLNRAENWQDFREALRMYDYPSQNFVYGDVKGNIGMVCAGKMPLKPAGYDGGLLDGTISPSWRYIPFDSLPQSYDPDRQYLFSANQQPLQGKYYYSSRWFEDLYRPRRIDDLLSSGKKLGSEDMRQMQLDVTDLSVQDLHELLKKYTNPSRLPDHWQQILKWNGGLLAEEKEAAFYKTFRYAAMQCAGNIAAFLEVRSPPSFDQLMYFLANCDSVSYKKKVLSAKDCFSRLIALTDSLYAVYHKPGTVQEGTAYSFNISQMSYLPGLDLRVDDVGGSDNTINVNYGAHPVVRTLIELSDSGIHSWMIKATGQTGRLNDKGYWQELEPWKANRLHRTQFVPEAGELRSVRRTVVFQYHK